MKKRLITIALTLLMMIGMLPAVTYTADAAAAPTKMWVVPTEDNGLPAQIDVFRVRSGTSYVYQLYLPGNVDPDKCFLSWDGDLEATYGGRTYTSGHAPAPPVNEQGTYSFINGSSTTTFNVTTYQGSGKVQAVFIDIDESKGTIAAMDGDPDHNATCTGRINISGIWYDIDKMKGRGNATWSGSDDKRPYNVTLTTKIKFPGITSDKTKKWSFMAECLDHSLLCNRVGFIPAFEMGIGQDTTSADVWMNGEYQGCYMITPKTDSFVTKNGFMIEQDNYLEPEGGDPQFKLTGLNESSGWSSCYNRITVKKMGDNLEANPNAVSEIQSWLQDAWDAIRSGTGYNSKGKYYTEYIDIESFAKMYIMHEYVKSYDVCAGSILYHRDGMSDSDKLIAGPLWDLDNALGATFRNDRLGKADDRTNGDRRSGEGDFIPNITEYKTSVYKTLSKHADFMEEVYKQYNLNRSLFENLPLDAQRLINEINESALMNHTKVNELQSNIHKYSRNTTLGSGQYRQTYLATSNSKTDWPNYAANLKTFIKTRTLWFKNKYTNASYPTVVALFGTTEGGSYTVTQDGTESSAITRTSHRTLSAGTAVTVKAVPKEGYIFKGWYNGYVGNDDVLAPLMDDLVNADAEVSFTAAQGNDVCMYAVFEKCTHEQSMTENAAEEYLSTPADCIHPAVYYKSCSLCGAKGTETFEYGDALGHDYQDIEGTAIEPTCSEDGKAADKKCARCGEEAAGEVIEKTGHTFDQETAEEKYLKSAADCVHPAVYYMSCSKCGEIGTDTFESGEALGHDYQEVEGSAVEPTCTEDGKHADQKCTRCDDLIEGAVIGKTGHTEEVIPAVEPTCTDTGLTAGTKCSVCGEILTEQEEIPALGHAYEKVEGTAIEATCTEDGKEADQKCTRCGDEITGKVIKATGHNFDQEKAEEKYLKTAADCTHPAVYYMSCSKCGATGTETFENGDALGHAYEEVEGSAIEATCTEDGKEADQKCSRCNDLIEGAVVKATGHNFDQEKAEEKYLKTGADCIHPAVYYMSRSKCGEKSTETFENGDALGHAYEEVEGSAIEATRSEEHTSELQSR